MIFAEWEPRQYILAVLTTEMPAVMNMYPALIDALISCHSIRQYHQDQHITSLKYLECSHHGHGNHCSMVTVVVAATLLVASMDVVRVIYCDGLSRWRERMHPCIISPPCQCQGDFDIEQSPPSLRHGIIGGFGRGAASLSDHPHQIREQTTISRLSQHYSCTAMTSSAIAASMCVTATLWIKNFNRTKGESRNSFPKKLPPR